METVSHQRITLFVWTLKMTDSFYPLLPAPLLMPAWRVLIGPAKSLPHSVLIGVFLQTSPLATLCNTSESQLITSALKMETAQFSKILACINQSRNIIRVMLLEMHLNKVCSKVHIMKYLSGIYPVRNGQKKKECFISLGFSNLP
jgi:hypothetical protein